MTPKEQLTIRLRPAVMEALKARAAASGESQSETTERLLSAALGLTTDAPRDSGWESEMQAWIASLETRIKTLELLVGEAQREPDGPMGLVRPTGPGPIERRVFEMKRVLEPKREEVVVPSDAYTFREAYALSREKARTYEAWTQRIQTGTHPEWEYIPGVKRHGRLKCLRRKEG